MIMKQFLRKTMKNVAAYVELFLSAVLVFVIVVLIIKLIGQCFFDIWQMSLKNINGVIQCNRHDRTSALLCNFKGTGMEWKKT